MKILMVSSEAVPFAKTGGLADAVSALSMVLTNMGHEVKIVLPRYYKIDRKSLTPLAGAMGVGVGGGEAWTEVYKTQMPGCPKCEVYFIDHEQSFGRDGIYGVPGETDFHDNPYRFSILCHGAFQLCRKINWMPDIIHAHDWSAALALALLKHVYRWQDFGNTAGVLSIHNLGYQGQYSKDHFPALGIDWGLYYGAGFEHNGGINFLQAGISCADMVTTVSPTYAREIQTPEGGFGMDGLLRVRSDVVRGILNGCDLKAWNPAVDKKIPATYSVKSMKGKAVCKAALQKQFGLKQDPDVPLFATISRFAEQKGLDVFARGLEYLAQNFDMQFVVIGSGDMYLENWFRYLAGKFPGKIGVYIGYASQATAHLTEAGADFFVMPSRYEPCGLNQMYSMRYGTLPIVRSTGGLADTVINLDNDKAPATGFVFWDLNSMALNNTITWAANVRKAKPDIFNKMIRRAMTTDFSWNRTAGNYERMYEDAHQ